MYPFTHHTDKDFRAYVYMYNLNIENKKSFDEHVKNCTRNLYSQVTGI